MQTSVLIILVLLEVTIDVYAVAPVITYLSKDVNNPAHKLSLDEDKKGGDVVAILKATDADTDDSKLAFSISTSKQTTKDLFEIVNLNTLKVRSGVAANTFDYEKEGAVRQYEIRIVVSDGSGGNDTLTTTIDIKDVNEKPVFSGNEPYIATLAQSTSPGTLVYKVDANDPEDGKTVTYALSGAPEFEINSNTGVIKVTPGTVFNKQITPNYTISVTATDNGNPRLAVATTVRFYIAIKPTISPSTPTTASVNENAAIGTSVFTVNVADSDTPSGSLTVSIKSQSPNTPTDMFKLENGVLKTNNYAFDAEVQRTYALVFQVSDETFIVDSATLTVNVNDMNDNSPVINNVNPITIPENKQLGSAVVDVDAKDDDISPPNNVLTYAIVSGNTGTTFGIIASSGVFYLLNAPLSSSYTLKVKVSDKATPATFSEIDIVVNVDGNVVNECAANPCKNGATCTPSVNTFSCTCIAGYSGSACLININDCQKSPCKNGGTCTDKVNSYTCTCSDGYKGSTCEEVCTENKYGKGCSQTCNCNASRLVENVGTQTCNRKTGYCMCNSKWTGPACEKDIDECKDTTICNATPNKVCENTADGYFCACEVGYKEKTDKTCEPIRTAVTLTVGANEYKITIKLTLDKPCLASDLKIPTIYAALKKAIEAMLQAKLPSALRVVVYNIKCGSLVFDSQIIIHNTDAEKSRVASDLQNIRNGDTVAVDGVNTKATALTVNGYALIITSGTDSTGTKVCRVYSTLVTCPSGQTCQYVDNIASCRIIQMNVDDDDENKTLILGLGLGLGLPIVLFVIIAVVCCFWAYNRQKYKEKYYGRDRGMPSRNIYGIDLKDEYIRSYIRPKEDMVEYVDKTEFYGLPRY